MIRPAGGRPHAAETGRGASPKYGLTEGPERRDCDAAAEGERACAAAAIVGGQVDDEVGRSGVLRVTPSGIESPVHAHVFRGE